MMLVGLLCCLNYIIETVSYNLENNDIIAGYWPALMKEQK